MFDVQNVELSNSNLIEASAGTGKTFSIAILVLRLIIEKDLGIKQILMVTFTKAAVAELENRIRQFVRVALLYSQNPKTETDTLIKAIVDNAITRDKIEIIQKRLEGAQLFLDETSIFTIHSFCQKTLTEFAFETNQIFGSELLNNQSELIEKAVNEYWRKEISQLSVQKLELLQAVKLSKTMLSKVVKEGLAGKKFVYREQLKPEEYFINILEEDKKIENLRQKFNFTFETSEERTISNIESGGKNCIKSFVSIHKNASLFLEQLIEKQSTKYVINTFPTLSSIATAISEHQILLKEQLNHVLFYYYGNAIESVKEYVDKAKQRLSVLTFDDLILNLNEAVKGPKQDNLKYELQKKYKAVFIDEFQDTDQLQYEIFDTLFGMSSILFYIGDPKQAIYSFRGADIDTYVKASNSTNEAFTMRHNFRSTPNLTEGLNQFFSLVDNPFSDINIQYEIVSNGRSIKELTFENVESKPISYTHCSSKEEIAVQCSYQILNLLNQDYKIEGRRIIPSDIGVLVRSKKEGKLIKKYLNKLQVPSVTIDDSLVMESHEAALIYYVLKSAIEPSRSNLNRALLSSYTGVSKPELRNDSLDHDINNFKNILNLWQKKGVLTALSFFLKVYQVKANLLSSKTENGERMLTNTFQVIELLNKKEFSEKMSSEELLNYLHNTIEGKSDQGDEYTQRIESDENAVNIVTIHKSKGLAYNMVFAPYLDLTNELESYLDFVEYKNKDLEACFSLYKDEEEKAKYSQETAQENRRLIYVALTRAVYKVFIFINNYSKTKNRSSLRAFTSQLESNKWFEELNLVEPTGLNYLKKEISKPKVARIFTRSLKKDWAVLSYSQLSKAHQSFEGDKLENWESKYDQFVFSDVAKGANMGNFLHDLFENSDFKAREHHDLILEISKKYSSLFDKNQIENYNLLIQNVLHSKFSDRNFCLAEVAQSEKLPELEFYFNISDFSPEKINKISHLFNVENSNISQGMMYGFIDLFFKHNNKYYILDWKSNFLGNSLNDYSQENMGRAMEGNNYHTQYLIYSVAVQRFLRLKLSNFDYDRDFGGVLYVFLRGCRSGENSGIFFLKPPKDLIDNLDQLL